MSHLTVPDTIDPFTPVSIRCFCPNCEARFTEELPPIVRNQGEENAEGLLAFRCYDCRRKAESEMVGRVKNDALVKRETSWALVCPVEFRTTEEQGKTERARIDQEAIRQFVWGGAALVYMHGPPGTLKTRMAWRIARAFFDQGGKINFEFLSSWQFQAEASDASGKFVSLEWMDRLTRAELVVIDDLGKCSWTDTAAAAFFEMVDQRGANGRKTVITSNMDPFAFKEWMAQGRSKVLSEATGAIARRIREQGVVVACK